MPLLVALNLTERLFVFLSLFQLIIRTSFHLPRRIRIVWNLLLYYGREKLRKLLEKIDKKRIEYFSGVASTSSNWQSIDFLFV